MIGWIVLAVVVVSLLVPGLAVRAVLRRLPALQRVQIDLQRRLIEAQKIGERADGLREEAEILQAKIAITQARITTITAKARKKEQTAG
ncbi:hypothetical protein [Hamadaea tsunoensis]|uniref:hypothetical protein n=1 Tax=Hamadaea tsunoensis TaxID=53368 RepID=UPI0004886862|nr:hypothetical protein [Hamadaea tsunoensis]